jgi:hypothetical protein
MIQGLVSFSLDKLTEYYFICMEQFSIFFHKLVILSYLFIEIFLVFLSKSLSNLMILKSNLQLM